MEPNSNIYIGTFCSHYASGKYHNVHAGSRIYGNKNGTISQISPNYSFTTHEEAKEWHHWAVIRYGEYFLVFCDGKISGTHNQDLSQLIRISANDSFDQTTICIGDPSSSQWLEQDLDDICLIKGEALFIDKSNPTASFSVPNTYLDVKPFIQTKKIFYNFRVDI